MTTVYIGGIFEYQNGATTTYYAGPNGPVALRRSSYATSNGIFYMLGDHLGSTSVLLNQNGTVAKQEYYYPFGGNRGSAFSNLTTKRFTGQYHEAGLPGSEGLSYYNARWYDAQLGRFISADTLIPFPVNPQSFNRLSYVHNNPLRYIDPTGHVLSRCSTRGGACGTQTTNPSLPPELVHLNGAAGTPLYSRAERQTLNTAALKQGDEYARVINQRNARLWRQTGQEGAYQPVSGREAFLMVHGQAVTFYRTEATCGSGCYGERTGTDFITVYANAIGNIEGNYMWVNHELMHDFNGNAVPSGGTLGQPYRDLAANPIVVGGQQISPSGNIKRSELGYKTNLSGGRTPYRNSWNDFSVGEDFADMGANWVNNDFALTIYGTARYNWMETGMSNWIWLAISHNR